MDWEPRIVAFCCNWCSYAGADLAGVSRFQYPPNVRIVRVMCSGRVEPHLILKTLRAGADGILVTGCHPGDCHYISGNERARERVNRVHLILENLGIGRERVGLEWVSASEGQRFAGTITDFVEQVRRLGPNRLSRREGAKEGGRVRGVLYPVSCILHPASCLLHRVSGVVMAAVGRSFFVYGVCCEGVSFLGVVGGRMGFGYCVGIHRFGQIASVIDS